MMRERDLVPCAGQPRWPSDTLLAISPLAARWS